MPSYTLRYYHHYHNDLVYRTNTPINPPYQPSHPPSSQYRNDLVQLIVGKPIRASKLDRKGDAYAHAVGKDTNKDATNNNNDNNDDATSKPNDKEAVT